MTTYVFDESISSAVRANGKSDTAKASDEKPVKGPLSPEQLDKMQRYWQASNYLTVGQIYLPG